MVIENLFQAAKGQFFSKSYLERLDFAYHTPTPQLGQQFSIHLFFCFCLGSCLDNKIYPLWQAHGECTLITFFSPCTFCVFLFFSTYAELFLLSNFLAGYGWPRSHGGKWNGVVFIIKTSITNGLKSINFRSKCTVSIVITKCSVKQCWMLHVGILHFTAVSDYKQWMPFASILQCKMDFVWIHFTL